MIECSVGPIGMFDRMTGLISGMTTFFFLLLLQSISLYSAY